MALKSKSIFDKISFMPAGNRSIKPGVVKNLKHSVNRYGVLRSVVLAKTDVFGEGMRYYIADGQHLFLACQALDRTDELNFIQVPIKFTNVIELVEFVSTLNTTQSPWGLADYIQAFASTNRFISYNILDAKKKRYGLSYNLTAVIYSGYNKTHSARLIKEGNFRVVNEPRSDEIASIIQDLVLMFGRTNSAALTTFSYIFYERYDSDTYDHDDFKKYVDENLSRLLDSNEAGIRKIVEGYY